MAWILAEIILFVLWTVILVPCSKKNQEPKQNEKKPKTSSTSPSITASVDSVEKTCSKQTTVSKTISVQNEVEKEKKESSSLPETKECNKGKPEVKKVEPPVTSNQEQNARKASVKKLSKKELKESQTIKKMSLEKIDEREEDVKCDKEVSQKCEESDPRLHYSKKKVPEKLEVKDEMLEPTPLSWNI